MSAFLLLEKIIDLIPLMTIMEGIEQDTVGEAGGAPPSQKKPKSPTGQDMTPQQALQWMMANRMREPAPEQLSPEQIRAMGAEQLYQKQQEKQKQQEENPEEVPQTGAVPDTEVKKAWNGPVIPPDATREDILELTAGMRAKSSGMTYDEWIGEIKKIRDQLNKNSDQPGDKYDVAAELISQGLKEFDGFFKSSYERNAPWDLAFHHFVTKKLGNRAGSYLPKLSSTTQSRIAAEIRNKNAADYLQQQRAGNAETPGAPSAFQTPYEETIHKKYFQDFMKQMREMVNMYYSNDPEMQGITEDDWKDLERFLAEPTSYGPMFQVLQKKPDAFKIIVNRLKKGAAFNKKNAPTGETPVDPNDPTNRKISGPKGVAQDADQVTAMTRIFKPKQDYQSNWELKRHYDDLEPSKSDLPKGFPGEDELKKRLNQFTSV